jgi:hypothetical protein
MDCRLVREARDYSTQRRSIGLRIPLIIHTLVEDYRLFLHPHDVDGKELVCYAVPLNRMQLRKAT